MATMPPGWYEVPGRPGVILWWDGLRWHEKASDPNGTAPGGCELCGQPLGMRRLAGNRRCGDCRRRVTEALKEFRHDATYVLHQGMPEGPHWDGILGKAASCGVPPAEALLSITDASVRFLDRLVTFAAADGVVSNQEIQQFDRFVHSLMIPPQAAASRRQWLDRQRVLGTVRSGVLPRLRPADLYLDIDETCHFDTMVQSVRWLKAGPVKDPGRLVATDKKLRFLSGRGGWETNWSKIMQATARSADTVHLQMTQIKGTGEYLVGDAEYTAALIETAARISRRQILSAPGQRDTRAIPQHIKSAVWNRDRGRCVECAAEAYLEFDHVIPLSKGGATSEGNLQLLCRRCNLNKGARI
ncbi:HNH endonuclease [Actinoplanes sp. NPDC051494]|uniref:HNH endonuclease n=1 Tax=Actinoplanes sp. NPDC051494 TaxID=3363907 RepID=UPI0037ACED34